MSSVNKTFFFKFPFQKRNKRMIGATNLLPINNKKKRENIVYIYFHNNCDYQLTRRMPSTDDSRNTPVTEIVKCFFYNGFFISDKRIIVDDIVITIYTFIMAIIHCCCLTYFRVASYYFYTWIIIRLFVNKHILILPDSVDHVFGQGTCNELQ